MVRNGDQEQSSSGGARHAQGTPRAPLAGGPAAGAPVGDEAVARTPGKAGGRDDAGVPGQPRGDEGRPGDPGDPRQVPHPRRVPPRRSSLLRRPEYLRAIPSLARFLTPASRAPGDAQAGQHPSGPAAAEPETGGRNTEPDGTRPDGTGSRGTGPEGTRSDGAGSRGTGLDGTGSRRHRP